MNIVIKNRSDVPIYEQIEEQIRSQILTGRAEENEQLPSIRQLARDLKISVITTTRVYNDLAEDGFIISVAGKGYFVAPKNNELLRERMLYEMEAAIDKVVENGRNAGLSDEEIISFVRKFMEE
ncbi:MAG: GntR family transcriptional regulator [Ruminococcus sp.]|nr:GntR family transcriptional regulator [Ruminococcus sp.]